MLVVREPLAHADSLLRQHRRSAKSSGFERDYLRWLAHHEFGAVHRPFRFPGSPDGEADRLDYWLATWLACYRALEPVADAYPNVLVVSYERLCSDPRTWAVLCETIGIEPADRREMRTVASAARNPADHALASAAEGLHARYLERSHFP